MAANGQKWFPQLEGKTDYPTAQAIRKAFEAIYSLEGVTVVGTTVLGTAQSEGYYEIAGAATVTPDLANGQTHEITLDRASTIIAAPTFTAGTIVAGQRITIILALDATLGRQVTWNSVYVLTAGSGHGGKPLQRTRYSFQYRPDGKWEMSHVPTILDI